MCIVEQKTYFDADGSPRLIERIRRCENAVGSGTCPNTKRTLDTVRIVETKPESSSSSRKDEVVTDNNGRTRTYRDLSRRSSQKHKTGHSKRADKRDSVDLQRPAPSSAFESRRASPMPRPGTPNSAPPTMSSFTRDGSSEPAVRFRPNGTAVYDAPPSLLNMPRAPMNERLNTHPAERKVSFEDDRPRRHHPGPSNNTGARDSAMSSPTMASPGLSHLPSIRHSRNDSARDLPRDLPIRDFVKPEREDKEYASREFSRETLRRQQAEAEAIRRRQEDLEAAEHKQLDLEAERARHRRPLLVDPPMQPRRMPETLFPHHRDGFLADDEPSSWSRHTSPPAPPRLPRPTANGGTRYASASPLPTSSRSSLRRSATYGRATIHQYHYPDSPPVVVSSTSNNITSTNSSRRPSDSIRDRGREVIERERTRAAAAATEELRRAFEEGGVGRDADFGVGARRWEPVFDEVEERVSGREYYYVSEGPARQESRRRHGSWREDRKGDFWS
jgi:hypothetical protein